MSLPFCGRLYKGGGLIAAIAKQTRLLNFKPVNKITVQFDPFHEKAHQTRNFLCYITSRKAQKTNPTCLINTSIVCDRSEPKVVCNLTNGDSVLFKCQHLEALDILTLFNKHISSTAPPEPEPEVKGYVVKRKKLRIKRKISHHRR